MSLFSRLLPGVILLGTGMIIFGVYDIIGSKKPKTRSIHTNEICEICGVVDHGLIWNGVGVESFNETKRLIYDSTASVVLCNSCRNQSGESKAWQFLQKKER